MSRRAYVDQERGITKVILGDDEWQLEFKVVSATDAKKCIPNGDYSLKDVMPAVIDSNVLTIRSKLAQLSASVVAVYKSAERQEGFHLYDKETRDKTDRLAHEIQLIQLYGLGGRMYESSRKTD